MRTVIAVGTMLILAASLHAAPLKVYILAGQSNMEGQAKSETFTLMGKASAEALLRGKGP